MRFFTTMLVLTFGFMSKSVLDGDIVSSCIFASAIGMTITNLVYAINYGE